MSLERLHPDQPEWVQCHADHLARYFFAVDFARSRRVLDAGCGCGYGAAILKTSGASSVCGVDSSEEAIQFAKEKFGDTGADFRVDDCEMLETVSGPFDLICSFENIEHLAAPDRFLKRAAALLSPDGVLLCSTPDAGQQDNSAPANPYHVQEWSRAGFRDMLLKHFSDVELRVQVKTISSAKRLEAERNLAWNLKWLRLNPVNLFFRWCAKALGKNPPPLDIEGLGVPSVTDFPIVNEAFVRLLGSPFCHIAICKRPRNQGGK